MEAVSKQNNARNANFMIFLKFVTFLCFCETSESHFGRILVARGSQNEAKIMKKNMSNFTAVSAWYFYGFRMDFGSHNARKCMILSIPSELEHHYRNVFNAKTEIQPDKSNTTCVF